MSAVQPAPRAPGRSAWLGVLARPEVVTLALIVIFCALVSALSPQFLTVKTLLDTLRAAVTLGIFALGVLLVLAAGGIDVSFTAIAAFALYSATKLTLGLWPAAPYPVMVVVALLIGGVLGLVNGVIVYRFAVPSLIVTIGTQYLYRGALLAFIGTAH
ncbi:MAG: ABC transporter permease, partial [Deinococcus sp.]